MKHLEIIGWKAWYEDGKVYTSKRHKWNRLPTKGILALKRFFRIYEDGTLITDEKTGKSIFYEIMIGHPMMILDNRLLMKYIKLPKCIKLGKILSDEEIDKLYNEIEDDQEEPFKLDADEK